MATPLTQFADAMNAFIRSVVLTPLAAGFKAKGVEVTVDEMVAMLSLPSVAASPYTPSAPMPFLSGAMAGTSAVANGTKKAGRGARGVDTGLTCPYLYTKGDKKDKACGAKAKESGYCTAHSKKAEKKTESPIPIAGQVASQVTAPGLPNMGGPAGLSAVTPVVSVAVPVAEELRPLSVKQCTDGTFRDDTHGFILQHPGENIWVPVSMEPVEGGPRRPLDAKDVVLAQKYNMTVTQA